MLVSIIYAVAWLLVWLAVQGRENKDQGSATENKRGNCSAIAVGKNKK